MAIAALLFCFNLSATEPTAKTEKDMKSIIVYFTHSGNTELAAKKLADVTGAPMVRILPAEPYTAADVDWVNEQSRCTQEHLNQTLRPAIKPLDIDFSQYDTVFIGFPIWWHEEPAVIRTFLDITDLKGKNSIPSAHLTKVRCRKPTQPCRKATLPSNGTQGSDFLQLPTL